MIGAPLSPLQAVPIDNGLQFLYSLVQYLDYKINALINKLIFKSMSVFFSFPPRQRKRRFSASLKKAYFLFPA